MKVNYKFSMKTGKWIWIYMNFCWKSVRLKKSLQNRANGNSGARLDLSRNDDIMIHDII